jgi:hypothetical protein
MSIEVIKKRRAPEKTGFYLLTDGFGKTSPLALKKDLSTKSKFSDIQTYPTPTLSESETPPKPTSDSAPPNNYPLQQTPSICLQIDHIPSSKSQDELKPGKPQNFPSSQFSPILVILRACTKASNYK